MLNKPKEKQLYSNLSPVSSDEPGALVPKGQLFEIRIKGQLSDIWADWFEGLDIEYLDHDEMLLSGYIIDQAALMGVLNKLGRLNLKLISLTEVQNNNSSGENR